MNNENMVNNQPSEPVVDQPVVPENAPVVEQPSTPVEPVEPVVPAEPVTPVQPQMDTVQPMNTIQPSSPVSSQPKSNKGLIMGIIAVVLIAAVGIGVYFAFFRKVSGEQVVKGTVNMIFQKAIEASEEVEKSIVIDFKKDIVQSKGNATVSVSSNSSEISEILGDLKSFGVNYDLRLDLKTLSGSLDVTELENDKEVFNINTYIKNKILYLKSDSVSSMYKIDLTDEIPWDQIDISKLPEYNSAAYSNLLKKIRDSINKSIKEEYITQEEGEYVIDGTTIKGLKTTISITQKDLEEIEKNVINELKGDEEAVKIISEIIMQNEQDTKALLDNAANQSTQIEPSVQKTDKLNINIFTTKNGKFLGFQCVQKSDDIKEGIEAVSKNDIVEIKLYNEGKVVLYLEYNEKQNELSWSQDDKKLVIKFSKTGIKATYTMDGLKIEVEFNRTFEDESVKFQSKLSGEYNKDQQELKASLEYTNSLNKVDTINEYDTQTAKDFTKLTESEQESLINELNEMAKKSILLTILSELTKVEDNVTPTTLDTTYCAQAYACKSYIDGFNKCKYEYNGYEMDIVCPISIDDAY